MKLSVITINLNNKEGLQQTIDSVVGQTFVDYEFIVIDGQSTDGSLDIIEKNKDNISQWLSEPDTGVYQAMNKGIELAKGEYLYFLNSGDRLYSDLVFEKMFADQPQGAFICGNFYTENRGELVLNTPYKDRDWTFALYDIYSTYLCHQAFFIHRSNFEKYGKYSEDLKISADWELFLMAIGVHREAVDYRDVDMVIYNQEGLSSTIGGQFIYQEKKKVARRRLSVKLADQLDRMYYLEQNGYVVDTVKNSGLLSFLVRIYCWLKRSFSH